MGRGGVFWLLAAVMGLACSAPAPARRPSEAMERSARILRQLDRLEADLHQGSAEITTYTDLVARQHHPDPGHPRRQELDVVLGEGHLAPRLLPGVVSKAVSPRAQAACCGLITAGGGPTVRR